MFNELKQTEIFDDVKYDFWKHKADDIIYRYELIPDKHKNEFTKMVKSKSCLLNRHYFDFIYLSAQMNTLLFRLCLVGNSLNIFNYYKFIVKLMYKLIQIINKGENSYYFKFWNVKFYIKKIPYLLDVTYENDSIYVAILKKIKLKFKYEYSKLEKKEL